ncbi:hypothetical protein GPJ56_002606 [Histomonas meleagridis]|uniref:uncharacterized protein n=1 Tax=Histomonas meleagridis TaxID=135588 RepID=UPI003559B44F|nr:hypothetical protein GPJ56_002606 [Histomonas meleagridis]KAH0801398.1 hypothetical protein GO595_005993 [Histomonas meleagridis]
MSRIQTTKNTKRIQPTVISPRSSQKPVKKLSRKDIDSSSHRLSRVPQKFAPNKAVQRENAESFAEKYFRENPDAKDSTQPDEKLKAIEEKLEQEDVEQPEKFKLLVQQKALRFIIYGENSVQALRSYTALGVFYNQNYRPNSALRHLSKAHQLEEMVEIEEEESIVIAVETAIAHLALRNNQQSNSIKRANLAERAISKYKDCDIENPMLRYKRDISKARIYATRGHFDDAINSYEEAWNALDEANNGEEKEETAQLFEELSEACEFAEKMKKAKENYKRASEIYENLGMDQYADDLKQKYENIEDVEEEDSSESEDSSTSYSDNSNNNNEYDDKSDSNKENYHSSDNKSIKSDSNKDENENSESNKDENKSNESNDDKKSESSSKSSSSSKKEKNDEQNSEKSISSDTNNKMENEQNEELSDNDHQQSNKSDENEQSDKSEKDTSEKSNSDDTDHFEDEEFDEF